MQKPNPVSSSGLIRFGLGAAVAAAFAIGSAQAQTITKDKVGGYAATFGGNRTFSAPGAGHTGQAADYAMNFPIDGSGSGIVTDAAFLTALNAATALDEMTVALWVKKYDTAAGSAYWFASPSSNNGERGWQVHLPWSDNTIYFDTAGCCTAEDPFVDPFVGQRINANIDTYANYTGDVTWWTDNWHLFVLTKKGPVKKIYIDNGDLFLQSDGGAAKLPTDFRALYLGSDQTATGNLYHSLMDDFAVFNKELTEADIKALFSGTLPTALPASAGLFAYWDFNDFPPAGVLTVTPTPNTQVGEANVVIASSLGAAVPWTAANVSLKVDGVAVTGTVTTAGRTSTLTYPVSPVFKAQSVHTASVTYPDGVGGTLTFDWTFRVGLTALDKVAGYPAILRGSATWGAAGGGHTGQAADRALDLTLAGGPARVADSAFLAAVNAATANDELSVAIWAKKYDIADGSGFWFSSPSQSRVYQAHLPWSNNNIYFDTAGCCDAATQRMNAGIDTYSGWTGDNTFWTDNWHLFVFTKKADVKNVYIDGVLFMNGSNTGTLSTDIDQLMIGSDNAGGGLFHSLVDDFAVFGKELTEANAVALFNGTAPNAIAGAGLIAWWDFNEPPAEGWFSSITPPPGATAAAPNLVQAVHQDGSAAWDKTKVSVKIDNAVVAATVDKTGGATTVKYVPDPLFAMKSKHTAAVLYDGAPAYEWDFTVGAYTKDVLHNYIGVLQGPATWTADKGGKTGAAGDYAMDFGRDNARQAVDIIDLSFINAAAANDEMAVAGWQKLYQIADSAFFWGVSPSSSGTQRGWGTHAPWSNNNLYFDTAGCCDGATQRTTGPITDFTGYSGDVSWWNDWHHFVFQKKLSTKEIWIDGQLFLSFENTNPLPTDFTRGYLAFDPPDNATMRGIMDDFAIFAKSLTEAQVGQLFAGTKPNALPAAVELLAYWPFDDPPPPVVERPVLVVTRSGGNVTVTSTPQPLPAGFVLQLAPTVNGPWTTQAGANTPVTVPIGNEAAVFLRALKP